MNEFRSAPSAPRKIRMLGPPPLPGPVMMSALPVPSRSAARALFDKAAAQGHAGALERMGAFALSGRGGAQDSAAAKAYYEKAAALGNEEAKAALKRLDCPYVIKDKRGTVVSNL